MWTRTLLISTESVICFNRQCDVIMKNEVWDVVPMHLARENASTSLSFPPINAPFRESNHFSKSNHYTYVGNPDIPTRKLPQYYGRTLSRQSDRLGSRSSDTVNVLLWKDLISVTYVWVLYPTVRRPTFLDLLSTVCFRAYLGFAGIEASSHVPGFFLPFLSQCCHCRATV